MTEITPNFKKEAFNAIKEKMGINFKYKESNSTAEAKISLDALKISIVKINKKTVTLRIEYEFQGKTIAKLTPVEVSEGCNLNLLCTDGFKVQIKMVLS
jgi:spermidine/putrescine-binding protein